MAQFESGHLDALSSFVSAYRQCEAWLPPVDLISLADYGDILSKEEIALLHCPASAKPHGYSLPSTLLAQAKILHYFTATYRMRAEAAESQLLLHQREAALLKQRHSEVTLITSFSQEKQWNAELRAQELQDEVDLLKEKNTALQREINKTNYKLAQATGAIARLERREESLSFQLDQALATHSRDTAELRRTVLQLREELLPLKPEPLLEIEYSACPTPASSTDTFGKSLRRNRDDAKCRRNSSWMGHTLRDVSLELTEAGLHDMLQSTSPSNLNAERKKHYTRKPFPHRRSASSIPKITHPILPSDLNNCVRRKANPHHSSELLAYQRPLTSRSRLACEDYSEKRMVVLDADGPENVQGLAQQILVISDQMLRDKIIQASVESPPTAINSPPSLEAKDAPEEPGPTSKWSSDSGETPVPAEQPTPLSPSDDSPLPSTVPLSKHLRGESITETPSSDAELAVQRAMEGEFVYKSSRTLLGQEKRHLRYMWINPQSNALYWCSVDPGTQRSLYMDRTHHRHGARSAIICGIRLIADPWSPSENHSACFAQGITSPSLGTSISQVSLAEDGKKAKWTAQHNQLPILSIVVQVTGREIKIKARNIASHKAWESALLFLQPNWPPSLPSSISSRDLIAPKASLFPLRTFESRKTPCRSRRTRIQYLSATSISPSFASPAIE